MDRPATTLGIRHIALKCRDLSRLERFYEELLGYRVEWRPDPENAYLTNGFDSLALHVDAQPTGESRLDHMGVLVETPEAVDEWAAFLKSRNVVLDTAPRTHRDGCRSFYVQDPEGNRIQFLWHPQLSVTRPPVAQ
jgi:catechol 2,3-dioxygenase-like lactoylglutathione lyase family enzyme